MNTQETFPRKEFHPAESIDRLKALIAGKSERIGRKLTAKVNTFGCQMNARDSEKLLGILLEAGFEEADTDEADFVLYNTCTVRENAADRVYGRLGALKGIKANRPGMKIGLCGCMMQEEQVVAKIKESYPFVDLIFGTHNLYRFPEYLLKLYEQDESLVEIWKEADQIVEELPVSRKYPFKSGVNISFGCNNFCTYCIVPYVRGRERSRRPIDILREIEALAKDGVIEIMLLGQNVNSYGHDLTDARGNQSPALSSEESMEKDPGQNENSCGRDLTAARGDQSPLPTSEGSNENEHADGQDTDRLREELSFAELLREVEKIDGIRRIRFMTSHPKDLSDELIEVMAESKKICRHLHLPLQSGSDRILSAMNRKYTKEHYLGLVKKLRSAMPDIAITTDIIVGFPGETASDVDETIDVVKQAQFENAFTFQYSKRRGTPAATMENQVPPEEVQKNFDRLLSAVQEMAKERAARFTGETAEVLVEEVNPRDPSLLTGRMSQNLLVHFPGDPSLVGTLVKVKLQECRGFYFMGERILT